NKLFEYIACGLPVLSFPHRALSRFLKDHDLGLVIEMIPGIAQRLRGAAAERARNTVRRRHHDFTMEANLPRVLEIYEQLLNARNARGR
ncbi:MAG: glycosyltransferase family 4 protein, partial [bacterium]|nr:glycosyltransferase family 4 protein [bacterium]